MQLCAYIIPVLQLTWLKIQLVLIHVILNSESSIFKLWNSSFIAEVYSGHCAVWAALVLKPVFPGVE